MRLYVLRHGDAPFNPDTGERTLSEPGRAETAQIVGRRAKELASVPLIVCSPVRRARETLAVLQQTLPSRAEVLFADCLLSESRIPAVEAFVNKLEAEALLLVSHQPLVGYLLNYLTDRSGMAMSMGTSCLASLELITFSRGCGTLQWLECPQ